MYFFIVADVNFLAAHIYDSVMADTDSNRDSVMTDPDSDEYDNEVELEIATAYIQLCIEYVQKYYIKRPICTSILNGRSYVIKVLQGNPQVCYDIFRMDKTIFRHLCNELKRLHLLEEDTGIVSIEEVVGTVLFIVRHNADYRLTANCFQHSLRPFKGGFGVPCVLSMLWDVSSFGPMLMQFSFLIHFEGMRNITHDLRYALIFLFLILR